MLMVTKLLATRNDVPTAIARVVLGLVMFPHGAQKLLGWFGGPGPSNTIAVFEQAWGIPAVVTVLVIIAEFFGSLGLIVGLLSRVGAAGVAAVMLGSIALQHAQYGFFMNWTGQAAGEGFEYHLLALALAAIVILRGGGAWSVDSQLTQKA